MNESKYERTQKRYYIIEKHFFCYRKQNYNLRVFVVQRKAHHGQFLQRYTSGEIHEAFCR
jgi:hypothetical protein